MVGMLDLVGIDVLQCLQNLLMTASYECLFTHPTLLFISLISFSYNFFMCPVTLY
jgi:hypothetical protein